MISWKCLSLSTTTATAETIKDTEKEPMLNIDEKILWKNVIKRGFCKSAPFGIVILGQCQGLIPISSREISEISVRKR